jgi:branched-chain amino acid transport system permease protein
MQKNTIARDLVAAAVALALLLSVPMLTGSKATTNFIIYVSANGLLAMSLNLLVGYTGLVSFGHALFFGAAGAYPFVLLMQNLPISLPAGILLTLGFAALLSLLIGAICVRLTEIYFSFLTLAFQMLIYSLMMNLVDYTGGDNGLSGIPRPPFLGINLAESGSFYAFACVVFVVAIMIMRVIVMSPFGYTLRLIRDNAQRATFLGVNVVRMKLICFVLAGTFASLGGIIMALFSAGAYPSFAFWTNSGDAIFMIMLGGLNVFLGPVLGAVILQMLNDLVTHYTSHYGLFLGLLILLIVLGFRKGLLDFIFERRQAREQSALSAERKKAQG